MSLFESLGKELNYKDILQLDGAFSVAHINYDQSPIFNGIDSKDIARNSRKNGVSLNNKIDDIYGCLHSFDGTEKNYKKEDRIQLWKIYWLEYINAFDRLCGILPDSVVTIYADYFRLPEYKKQTYFAGNSLDMRWLSYNFALILLKLIYFNDLEKINTAKE